MSDPTPEPERPAAWTDLLVCERCRGPLTQPGALVLSPPTADGMVHKLHVCHRCYPILVDFLAEHVAELRDDSLASVAGSAPVPPIPPSDTDGEPVKLPWVAFDPLERDWWAFATEAEAVSRVTHVTRRRELPPPEDWEGDDYFTFDIVPAASSTGGEQGDK